MGDRSLNFPVPPQPHLEHKHNNSIQPMELSWGSEELPYVKCLANFAQLLFCPARVYTSLIMLGSSAALPLSWDYFLMWFPYHSWLSTSLLPFWPSYVNVMNPFPPFSSKCQCLPRLYPFSLHMPSKSISFNYHLNNNEFQIFIPNSDFFFKF